MSASEYLKGKTFDTMHDLEIMNRYNLLLEECRESIQILEANIPFYIITMIIRHCPYSNQRLLHPIRI